MVSIKRISLIGITAILSVVIFFHTTAAAANKEELTQQYRKLDALNTFINNCINKGTFEAYRIEKDSTGQTSAYNNGAAANVLTCSLGGGYDIYVWHLINEITGKRDAETNPKTVRDFMISLGYTIDRNTGDFKAPGKQLTGSTLMDQSSIQPILKKNLLAQYNGGKEVSLTNEQLWAGGLYYLNYGCDIQKIGNRNQLGEPERLALDKFEEIDGHHYIEITSLNDRGDATETFVYTMKPKSVLLPGYYNGFGSDSVTVDMCKDFATRVSKNAPAIVKNNEKKAAQTTTDTIINSMVSDICKTYPEGREQEHCQQTAATKVRICYNDRRGSLDDIFLKCLGQSFPSLRDSGFFSEEWLNGIKKKAEEAANDSLTVGGEVIDSGSNQTTDPPTCTIEGIGWLLCPVMKFIAGVNDALFSMISSFLTIDKDISDTNKPAFKVWSSFRNIANGLFAITFLVVIFSQVTGTGLSNYNIKQIAPRLIMASILINASFYICQVAIDLSNIFGVALKQSLESIVKTSSGHAGGWESATATILIGGGATIAAAAMAIYAIGIPGAIAFLVATLMTVMILVGRKAGVILLTALSPLAFAAWILPNTERWFRQWAKMFTGLLVVFPVISLLFGAGALASSVIGNSSDFTMQIAALVASAIPLFATPTLLKKSMDSLGSIGQIAGNLSGRLSGAAKDSVANSDYMKHRGRLAEQRRAKTNAGDYDGGRLGRLNPRRWQSKLKGVRNRSATFNKITGGYGERLILKGAAVAAAQDKEAMEAANASVSSMNLDSQGLMNLIEHGKDRGGRKVTDHQRRAAMQQLAPMMTGGEARHLASLSAGFNDDMRKEAAAAIRTAAPKAPWLGGKSLSDIQAGTYKESDAMDNYIKTKLSADDFNTMDAASIDALNAHARAQAASGDDSLLNDLRTMRAVHSRSSDLTSKISTGNRNALRKI